ncbi:MAG: glycosyltransferase family 2 protein [Chloroflexota bacterium]
MKLSVIIPVYNEASTLSVLLERVLAVPIDKEVIIVDDGSDQATKDLLKTAVENNQVSLITHPHNQGKGTAICTALKHVHGDVIIIQDADLEYYPEDYPALVETYIEKSAKAVYGVRDLSERSALMKWGNYAMTFATNILFGSKLNDMETCYKLIDRKLMQSLKLNSRGFEIEGEITSKLLALGVQIEEAPIRYEHREEGKKLTPWDGIPTLLALLKTRFGMVELPAPQTEN